MSIQAQDGTENGEKPVDMPDWFVPETYKDVEIMVDMEKEKIVKPGQLTPEWWI